MSDTRLYASTSSSRAWSLVLVLVAVCLAHLWVVGAPVPADDGRRLAAAFLTRERTMDDAYRQAVGVPDSVAIEKSAELRDPETGDVLGFVFDLDPQGFVVVTAETRIVPVIACSYEGSFPWEETEENILLSMLRFDLRGRMEALAQASARGADENERLWESYLGEQAGVPASPIVYGPWLTTKWHQESPYSDTCPLDSVHGGRSVVGCVATAVAQILNYWQYPTAVTFTEGDDYSTTTHSFPITASTASFSGLNYGTGEPSDTDKAKLCFAAGVSVRMDYCSLVSGARLSSLATALAGGTIPCFGSLPPQRWGYESADFRSYDSYYAPCGAPYYVTEEAFYSALSDDMEHGRPAALGIKSTAEGGHAVVVDGWQGSRMYHLNCGWADSHNAWYSLPEDLPEDYTIVRCAVLNICPPAQEGAYACGSNCTGQLGLGDTTDRLVPTHIPGLSGVRAVAAPGKGNYDTCSTHSLFLLENGDLYACGFNGAGQFGLGDQVDRYVPTRVDTLPGPVTSIAAGNLFSVVCLENGDVYASGINFYGMLGLGSEEEFQHIHAFTPVTALPGPAMAVSAGHAHSLYLLENGDVYGAGWNGSGPLGQGTSTEKVWLPVKVLGLPGRAMAIAAAELHSLVVLENGDVYAFGENFHGQLGLGDTDDRLWPQKVPDLPGPARAVAGGMGHSLFLLQSGEVYACGLNASGQLGQGDTDNRHTVVKVLGLPGRAIAVAAGELDSLVLLEDGDVYAFGENWWSQLGLGDTVDRSTPTLVGGVLQPTRAIAAGRCHSLFVRGALSGRDLPAPFDISASDGTHADRVRLTWSAVSGATSYVVQRAAGQNGTFVQIASPSGTSFDDTGVTPGQLYCYRLASCDSTGCGAPSPIEMGNASTTITGTSSVFRVTASGEVRADGGWYGGGLYLGSADVAEWVSVSGPVEPGTVLELDPQQPGAYRRSQTPCSTLVAGVVSSQPGMVLGGTESAEGYALLALSGIVPVKVTNEGGPIQPGDLLVSSSTPGYAMRWAGDGSCPCTLVGKALEPMTDERGVISVLLTAH